VTLKQIDVLLRTVPAGVDAGQRRRLDAHAATARRCEARIRELRDGLEQALRDAADDPDAAIAVARELDGLERVQPRIDGWLKAYVTALVDERAPQTFGEGPA
jgi:hypothetical protein